MMGRPPKDSKAGTRSVLSVRIPPALLARYKAKAANDPERTVSDLAEAALEDYAKAHRFPRPASPHDRPLAGIVWEA